MSFTNDYIDYDDSLVITYYQTFHPTGNLLLLKQALKHVINYNMLYFCSVNTK